jgi:hypothetical protein
LWGLLLVYVGVSIAGRSAIAQAPGAAEQSQVAANPAEPAQATSAATQSPPASTRSATGSPAEQQPSASPAQQPQPVTGPSPQPEIDQSAGPTATQPTAEQVQFFENHIRPLLAEHCWKCHGAEKQRGGLRLDSRTALLRGGESGPAIVPGKPEESLLIEAVNYASYEMPPEGRLPDALIERLTQWVALGAPWPGHDADVRPAQRSKITDDDRQWWAFQPVRPVPVPHLQAAGSNAEDAYAELERTWVRNDIDRFILAAQRDARLVPAPEADKLSLLRRVYFDLIGLPPGPDEIAAFLADDSPQAYEHVVDRLLASPHYGERWARHWLDLVRYAESDGYRKDDYRPHAWRYRDYVIDSLNEDKPYDRFVQEQIAGDELFPGDPQALVATGYLRHWIYEYNQRDVVWQWSNILNDITDTTGDVFLGLGLQCARCHDHKFDPILQRDYYRLQAFFAGVLPQDVVAATEEEVARHREASAQWEQQTATLRQQLDELEAPYRRAAERDAIEKFPPEIQEMIRKPAAERSCREHQLAELAYRQVYEEWANLDRRFKPQDKERILALRKELAAFDALRPPPLPVAHAVTDVGPQADPVYIPRKENEPIEPGFLTVLDEGPAAIVPLPQSPGTTGRRAALAAWLTRSDNPLTTRVIVNRVWQYHFGRGLAANSSDFGRLGSAPSHPELLDWLTGYFLQHGWRLKPLHRLIVTSATYRQSSRHPQAEHMARLDAANRYYWRADTRRLDAEQIRDALLAATGELDLHRGGPGVESNQPRRTIYTRVLRNTRDPLLEVFDLPLFFRSESGRVTTTTPVQSLLLFNSQTMLLRAEALAERLLRDSGGDEQELLRRAWLLVYGRPPHSEELDSARQFLREQARRIDPEAAGSAAAAFLHDKIPYRDGQAAVVDPEGPQSGFVVPHSPRLPRGDFTIEAFFVLRSVYDSGSVRTIAAKWDGNVRHSGWLFGVTGKQSRRKPQTLVLQLVGDKLDGTRGEEAIFSDQHVALGKPYFAAASVKLARDGQPGEVTFFLKDLSNDDEPLLTARVSHQVTGGFGNTLPLTLGCRNAARTGAFDGLLDDVRLSHVALSADETLFTTEGTQRHTAGYWQFEARSDVFGDSSGNALHITPAVGQSGRVDPRQAALRDLCHVLLNSNEFLYVP